MTLTLDPVSTPRLLVGTVTWKTVFRMDGEVWLRADDHIVRMTGHPVVRRLTDVADQQVFEVLGVLRFTDDTPC